MTFTVSVTETGSGGDTFGNLAKEVSDNQKTVNDSLNSLLSPKSSGGSTKK